MLRIKWFLILLASLFLIPGEGSAIPAFAKKYGFNCNMCHTAFAKLNDFGQRYRDNGYQIPGQVGGEKNIFETPPPIALRAMTGVTLYDGPDGTTSGFNIFGFDLLAAGMLHKDVSFLLIYTPRIDEPAGSWQGPENGANPGQMGALEAVNLVFSNVIQDVLNFRVGKFEPGYHPFSSKRKYQLFTPYEVYAFTAPFQSYNFDDNQIGMEASGHFRSGLKYSLGLLNGTGANPDNNTAKDLYGALSQTFGKGDGQSAGQRIGLFGYYGWQPAKITNSLIAPTGETAGSDNAAFYRFGVDASLNWQTLNLQALYMLGQDDKKLNALDHTQAFKYSGGLVQLDWAGLANNRLVASALYNWVEPPDYNLANKVNTIALLTRYYLGDWSAVNVSLHAEFQHRQTGELRKVKENLGALALDFAF
ncbi:MAG TPA: hypothetical protein PLN61_07600 [bacterium]|nr:hypothetical protein [bacterium]HQI48516.1 hypothetical protein [bacterium]HQJ63061.1 hypothetical protein [bacterium]